MDLILPIFKGFMFTYVLWLGYLACMPLLRHRNSLSLPAKVLGYPYILAFLIADALYNFSVMSILLLEPPHIHKRELLTTSRLKRHLRAGPGGSFLTRYRFNVARFYCHELLDKFDPSGTHC